ncbi:MAG: InlB B-repeat-containing protein, partial [Clostridia bacterium]|nr:InlB B-repeat-containing protein [Clostridia bacterium]
KSDDNSTITMTAQWNSAAVTLPNPTRTGYSFKGWYTDTNYTIKVGNAGDSYTPETNVTLYAKWEANTYTITYNANGGSVSPTSETKTFDASYGTLPTPTRSYCDFAGWYNGNTKVDSSTKVSTANNHTLTAHWSPYTTGYWHSGSRNQTVGTSGWSEYWQTGLNREALRAAGYTEIEISIKMNGYFISGDWFKADWWFKIYDRNDGVEVSETEGHWKTSWEDRSYSYTISIDAIRDDGTLYVKYGHEGDGADDFKLGTVEIWTTAK